MQFYWCSNKQAPWKIELRIRIAVSNNIESLFLFFPVLGDHKYFGRAGSNKRKSKFIKYSILLHNRIKNSMCNLDFYVPYIIDEKKH